MWSRDFVRAATAMGQGPFGITRRHVLPNIMSVLIVQATIQFAVAILAEAGLSYLGLGAQPPVRLGAACCGTHRPTFSRPQNWRFGQGWQWRWRCWASTCWAMGCAISSIQDCG